MKAKLIFDMRQPQDVDDFYAACLGPAYEAAIKEFRQLLVAYANGDHSLYPDKHTLAAGILTSFNEMLERRGICGV